MAQSRCRARLRQFLGSARFAPSDRSSGGARAAAMMMRSWRRGRSPPALAHGVGMLIGLHETVWAIITRAHPDATDARRHARGGAQGRERRRRRSAEPAARRGPTVMPWWRSLRRRPGLASAAPRTRGIAPRPCRGPAAPLVPGSPSALRRPPHRTCARRGPWPASLRNDKMVAPRRWSFRGVRSANH